MWYVLICLCLSLAGVAGLQFFYLAYLERIDRERKRQVQELERHVAYLKQRLDDAQLQVTKRNEFPDAMDADADDQDEEVWADVIEER